MSGLIHYRYIDALRGIAFLGVLTFHSLQLIPKLPGGSVAAAGLYGVQLFFVLSAVTLLRSASVRSGREIAPLRNFFVRRFFRIAPLFWFGIAFYQGLRWFYPAILGADRQIGAGAVVSTLLFLHGWAPSTINCVVPGGWSIAVEMTFYLCLPFLARRVTSAGSAALLTLFTLIASVALDRGLQPWLLNVLPPSEQEWVPNFLYYWFPSQLPVFLVGFIAYHLIHHPATTRFLAMPGRPAALGIATLAGLFGLTRFHAGPIPVHVCYAAAFGAVIVALSARPFGFIVNRFTCGLGVLSFSAYITHFAVLGFIGPFFQATTFPFLPASLSEVCRFALLWICALGLTAAASALSYVLIERPGIKLGNELIGRWEGRASSRSGYEKQTGLDPDRRTV